MSYTISAGERPQAAHLLRSWVRIPPGAWIYVCCECRVLSGRGLCDELITLPRGVLQTVVRRCVWSRNIKNRCSIYIYDISSLRVNSLFFELILLFDSTPTQQTEKLRPQWSFILVSCPCILVDFLEMCLYKGIIRRELGILQNGKVLTCKWL